MQLDQKLAPGIAEAHEALSSLANAGEEASQIESRLREQGRRAFEQAAQLETQAQAKISDHAADDQSQIEAKLAEQAAQFDSHVREQVEQAFHAGRTGAVCRTRTNPPSL